MYLRTRIDAVYCHFSVRVCRCSHTCLWEFLCRYHSQYKHNIYVALVPVQISSLNSFHSLGMYILPSIILLKKKKITLQVEKENLIHMERDKVNWQIVGRCWASFLHMNLLMRLNPDLQHPAWLMLWPLMTRNCRLLGCVALGWDFVFSFIFFLVL